MKLDEESYLFHSENYNGFCTTCKKVIEGGGVEPDAEEYECSVCENNTVMGVEQALICGLLTITQEDLCQDT